MSRQVLHGRSLALRGLWFRRSTALIVLVLATVASAASVIAPLYARAAEESILRDTLGRADPFTLAVQVSVPTSGAGVGLGKARRGEFTAQTARVQLSHPAFGTPRLAHAAAGLYRPGAGPFAGGEVAGQVVEREGVCAHLPTIAGRCPTARSEGMLSRRSLHLLGSRIGDTVPVTLEGAATIQTGAVPPVVDVLVVGSFDPVPVVSSYWAGRPYFTSFFPRAAPRGLSEVPPTADPVFLGPGTMTRAGVTTYTVDVPVRASRVQLGDAAVLRDQARRFATTASTYLLRTDTQLPAALEQADTGRELIRVAAPLAVTQLVLLSWWTLYLVVGSATEERAPELGLAKLRGLSPAQTRRFGLSEVVLLLLVAAPLGTALGWLAVRGAAGRVFAPGTEVRLTWQVLLTVLGALAGGAVTAALSSRHMLLRPVSELLRRVPPRRAGQRSGPVEVVVVVLAVAGVVQLVSDRGGRPSPVALLAPGLVAVAGGLLAGRVLVRVARGRVAAATARGRAPGLVGWASVARRPGTARIASVLAVATCLLLVGVQAWSVAERSRIERAAAETGAAVVLTVRAPGARELLQAVRAADPDGDFAMAAVQVSASSQEAAMLAVDSTRADRVLDWGAPGVRPAASVRSVLHPALPDPLVLRPGRLAVEVDLQEVDSPSPLRLTARLDRAGSSERVDLGRLTRGARTYEAVVPQSCTRGCRLAALAIDHPGTDIESASATLLVRSVSTRPAGATEDLSVVGSFAVPGTWRPGTPSVGGPEVQLQAGEALHVQLRAPGGPFAEIVHGYSPEPLPALVGARATGSPAERGGLPVDETTGLAGGPTRFRTDRPVDFAPRAGSRSVLVDLELALRLVDQAPVGDRQVWLSRLDGPAERALVDSLRADDIAVERRETSSDLERRYAGDGAALALRLLLVCGAAAVVVAVGALLVAAYVGRRQRAYEVAALRAVGLRRRTVRGLLVRENLGTVLVALACGALAAAVASWTVLPSVPQFDSPSATVEVRYDLEPLSAWLTLAGLAGVLVTVGLAVAVLQLRAGRPDRLREGVR